MLANKSLVELRSIAQTLDIPNIFQKDKLELMQLIDAKQSLVFKAQASEVIEAIQFEQNKFLSQLQRENITQPQSVLEILKPYVERGLQISFDSDRWYLKIGNRTDEGSLTCPLKVIVDCAAKLMK